MGTDQRPEEGRREGVPGEQAGTGLLPGVGRVWGLGGPPTR